MKIFWLLVKRDLTLAYRHRADVVNPLLFFVIAVSLFPLSISPESKILQIIAPGIIWVAALLSAMLALDSLFRADFEDGTLEQLLLSAHSLPLLVLAKVLAHWLMTGLPLVLLAPLLGVLLFLPTQSMSTLIITLLLGTPVLSLVGAIGVALTVGLRRGGVLLSLLILPLYVPVLIFAANAVSITMKGLPVSGQLFALGALLSLSLTLSPFATAAALRISLS
ncbi:MAG: heme exporter protein CcmB [Thiotrichaceae bacterium IS1]|nr:MAG: heme exporter protein CcmB [Thiotrichaceae bacterium IS1]